MFFFFSYFILVYEVANRGVAYEVTDYEVVVFCFTIVILISFLSVQYSGKKWLICRVSGSVTSKYFDL